MNNSIEKYCGYLRKSRADHDAEMRGEEETLARHKQLLLELSEKINKPICKFYSEVVSGETISARPAMQELLADVEDGKWRGVFVVEVERLARGNTKDQGIVADAFKYSNTKIITLSKIYDPENEYDEEYFEFGLFMSRREYKTINRRLQHGRITSVKEGKFIAGTAPFGYNRIKISNDKGYTLEINPETAPTVLMIYDWYCNGIVDSCGTLIHPGADLIAAKLDSLGIKPAIKDKWSKSSIMDILRNETYTGMVKFGRRKETKSSHNGSIIKASKTCRDYLCVKGLHPAIIDSRLFEKAQKIRHINQKNTIPSHVKLQNPLSGIIYCKSCGTLMTRLAPNSHNKYSTLKCPNRYCKNISCPLFLVERQVLLFLHYWLKSYTINDRAIDLKTPFLSEIELKKAALKKTASQISTLSSQRDRAYNLLEQGIYSEDVFFDRQLTLNNSIAALKRNQSVLLDELDCLRLLSQPDEKFDPHIVHLLDSYETNPVSLNNVILKELIEKIYYIKTVPNNRGKLENPNFELHIYPKIPL